uniref:Immunoglobulin domain-containing protein n=1 Tax=Spermophilus dauricus TaxID=99837 RepID=A0A8C9UKR3_SPEDA
RKPPLLCPHFCFWRELGLCSPNEVTGPKTKSGPERGSLTVQCNYTSGWKTHRKYWCRGAVWRGCKTLVSTTGSEQELKRDRVSIRDDQENLTFMVTMEDLRRDDADIYWCGIERVGSDHGFPVNVSIDPGAVLTPLRIHPGGEEALWSLVGLRSCCWEPAGSRSRLWLTEGLVLSPPESRRCWRLQGPEAWV